MDQSIIDFFFDQGTPLDKIVEKRPPHLTPEQVRAGAIAVYDKIISGEEIKKINLARSVWEQAKHAKNENFVREQLYLKKGIEHIRELEERNKETENKLKYSKEMNKAQRNTFFIVSAIYAFLYLIYKFAPVILGILERYNG